MPNHVISTEAVRLYRTAEWNPPTPVFRLCSYLCVVNFSATDKLQAIPS